MPILLKDIRTEFQKHLNTQVSTSLNFRPGSGAVINVGENFYIDFRATNSMAVDSVQIKNVVYHIRVVNPAISKLLKPSPALGIARSGASPTSPTISDLAFPVAEYYLHPPAGADPKTLAPGEMDTISNLPAKALAMGSTTVYSHVYGDPDMDWLFPRMEDSPYTSKTLTVAE